MSKITVVGAGNVGATCANVLAHSDVFNEVVLIDLVRKDENGKVVADIAKGKALDIWQQAPVDGYSTRLVGGDDYALTAGSDICIITAGIPRKPGMSRDDLISTNAKIVASVTKSLLQHTKNPIIIVVSNPLDVMTYACWKASGLSDKRVIGMAGVLDTARYRAFLAEALDCSPKDIQAMLMGGHGDTMVPLPRYSTVAGVPVTEFLNKEKLDAIVERTKFGGGELVNLMGTSAWYAPGAAAAQMAISIYRDEKRIFPCCVRMNGQYKLNNVFVGAPVKLGKKGVNEVLKLKLKKDELELLHKSAAAVQEIVEVLNKMDLF